ncbi:MAG: ATP-binding protein [Spirochaetales bacterium]|nr:MAG: ATP-binding protein [Spirochaetales bacterium]
MQIIAVASGKGGVGKSLISANLALALAQSGRSVVLADLDLGGSNLHLMLGEQPGTLGVGTFLNNGKTRLDDIIIDTSWKNLRLIPGEAELPGAANIPAASKRRLASALQKLNADYLVLDLGAGTSFNTVDFFLLSGCGILVAVPTLTSTLNAYLFLKNAVFRILTGCYNKSSPVHSYMEDLRKDGTSLQKIHMNKLLDSIRVMDPSVYDSYRQKAALLRPRLVMNMLDNPKDINRNNRLRISARDYLGIEMESLGVIYRDQIQLTAQNSGLPIVAYKPQSVLAQAIYRITDKILEMGTESTGILTNLGSEDSFREAEMEAEVDFDTKKESLKELLHSGALTQGDLLETLRTQQLEINELKKENRFLKKKIVEASSQSPL